MKNPGIMGKNHTVSAIRDDYGSEGWGFESLRACHIGVRDLRSRGFLSIRDFLEALSFGQFVYNLVEVANLLH